MTEYSNCSNDSRHDTCDSYDKVNTDLLFIMDRLKIIKDKRAKTPWYRIQDLIRLRKEYEKINKEADEIGERLQKLHSKRRNPIQIVSKP